MVVPSPWSFCRNYRIGLVRRRMLEARGWMSQCYIVCESLLKVSSIGELAIIEVTWVQVAETAKGK